MKVSLYKYFTYMLAVTAALPCVGAGIGKQKQTAQNVLKRFADLVAPRKEEGQKAKKRILDQMVITRNCYQVCGRWVKADRGLTSNVIAYDDFNKGSDFSAWTCIEYLLEASKNEVSPSLEAAIFTLDDILKGTMTGLDGAHENIKKLKKKKVFGAYYTPFIANKSYSFFSESVYVDHLKPDIKTLKEYLETYKDMDETDFRKNYADTNVLTTVVFFLGRLDVTARVMKGIKKGYDGVTELQNELENPVDLLKLKSKFREAQEGIQTLQENKFRLPYIKETNVYKEGNTGSAGADVEKVNEARSAQAEELKKTDMFQSPEKFNQQTNAILDAFEARVEGKGFPLADDPTLEGALSVWDWRKTAYLLVGLGIVGALVLILVVRSKALKKQVAPANKSSKAFAYSRSKRYSL